MNSENAYAVRRAAGIKLLTTGGTIATQIDVSSGRSRPSLDAAAVAGLLPEFDGLDVAELYRRPSWSFSIDDMASIANAIGDEAAVPGRRALVVTCGTSLLEYVSYLTDLFLDSDVPVVFTGAMRKADEPDGDGPGNLSRAIAVADSPASRGRGVLICFAHRVMSARGVWKKERDAEDAFIDLEGDVGTVSDREVAFVRSSSRGPGLRGSVEPLVEMVKVYPGATGALLDAVADRGARGVVIEGTPGAGGVPPTMLDALTRLARADVAIVISSRAPFGRIPDPPTGGTGSPLAELPLISAGPLTTEKAWVLLSAVLGQTATTSEARSLFGAHTKD